MSKRSYFSFLLAYLTILALVPIITRNVLPYDMIENLYWGKELQLGYSKHPPLFAWISFGFYKLCFSWPESLYIVTQLNLLLGCYFIYKIAELVFEDESLSRTSVIIFMTSVCAVFGNEKFNANTILMSLYPMMFYFFIRMIKFSRTTDAFILGIASALAVLGKYISIGYIGCMGIFLLWNRKARQLLKTSLPYLAILTFLVCISWHLYWIVNNDFVTLHYALQKSTEATVDHFSCLNFVGMQILFYGTAFWAFTRAYPSRITWFPCTLDQYSTEKQFVVFISIFPQILLFATSLITGMRIGSFWGVNMFMTLGIYLLILNPKRLDHQKLLKVAKILAVLFAFILFAKLGIARHFLKEYDPTNATDMRHIAQCIDADWKKQFGQQRMRIIKTDKAMSSLHIFLNDSPSTYDVAHNDLFKIYNSYPTKNTTIAFLCKKDDKGITLARKFCEHNIVFENTIPVVNDYVVYYAFIRFEENDENES